MPGSGTAEIYFIALMMLLIFIVCGVSVFFFAKTYKKEMADRKKRQDERAIKDAAENTEAEEIVHEVIVHKEKQEL